MSIVASREERHSVAYRGKFAQVCVLLLQDLLQSCARGTREEPGTLTQGAPVFSGSSRLELNRTQNSRMAGARPHHQPIGDLEPTQGGVSRLGIEPNVVCDSCMR